MWDCKLSIQIVHNLIYFSRVQLYRRTSACAVDCCPIRTTRALRMLPSPVCRLPVETANSPEFPICTSCCLLTEARCPTITTSQLGKRSSPMSLSVLRPQRRLPHAVGRALLQTACRLISPKIKCSPTPSPPSTTQRSLQTVQVISITLTPPAATRVLATDPQIHGCTHTHQPTSQHTAAPWCQAGGQRLPTCPPWRLRRALLVSQLLS